MNTFSKTIAALGIIATTWFSTASADNYRLIDDLALSIARKSRLVVSETEYFRNTPQYRYILSDAREMCRLADHIHEVAYRHGKSAYLVSDLGELEARLHHLAGVFDQIERSSGYEYRRVASRTARVKSLLGSIAKDVRYLGDYITPLGRQVTLKAPVSRRNVYVPSGVSLQVTSKRSGLGRPTKVITKSKPVVTSRAINKRSAVPSSYGKRKSNGRTISVGGGSSRVTLRF